jgi:hypothetical protein
MPAPREIFSIEGLSAIREKLDPQRFREAIRVVAQDAFAPLVEEARAAAPVRTGKLAASIRVEMRDKGADFEVLLGTGVPYGHLVERGHRIAARGGDVRTPTPRSDPRVGGGMVLPRPFAEPAFRANEAAVIDAIERNLAAVLGWT